MQFNKVSTSDLKVRFEDLARSERKVTALVIEHIAEVDRRRAFLDWGFTSLFDYLKSVGYSESAAYRRILGARAFRQIPELKTELENGALKLSQVAQVQTVLKHEEKSGYKVSVEEKKELLLDLRHKSGRETQKILDERLPQSLASFPTEKHKRDDSVDLSLHLPRELYAKLQRIKELYSHTIPDGDWLKVLDFMADDIIKVKDPLAKKENKPSSKGLPTQGDTGAEVKKATKVSKTVSRFIFQRDESCQFRLPGGAICGSRHQLEIDHIQPRFAGGRDSIENLRLLCRQHNSYRYRVGK